MLMVCVLLASGTDAPALVFAEKYDAAFIEAAERNVPVLVLDFDGWATSPGNPEIHEFYEDKAFLAALERAVVLLAAQDSHEERKQLVDGKERVVCARFGSVPCDVHRDMLPHVFSDYGRDGELISPLFVVAAPDRKPLARFEHEQTPSTIVAALKKASQQLGAGLGRGDYVRLRDGLAEARRLVDLNEIRAAVAIVEELGKIPGSFTPQARLEAEVRRIDDLGRQRVQRAEELYAGGRRLEALLEMDDVRASFGKLASASSAAARVAAWEKEVDSKPFLRDLKAHRAARQLYDQGIDYDRAGDSRRALQTLEKLIRTYPESRFADRARGLVEALRNGD